MRFGILPKSITLRHHEERFRQDGLLEEHENKMAYFIQDSDKNEKFIKDTIYGKVFITPRNKLAHDDIDYRTYERKNLYKHNSMIFNIYLVYNIVEAKENYRPYHWQIPGEHCWNSLWQMDERYAHDDKILGLSKTPVMNIKLVQQAKFEFTKQRTVDIKLI